MAWWSAVRHHAEDFWQQVVFQWELASAGAEDMQWVDTLDFFWDSLPEGEQLTAKEKREIAASLKHLVRQQSTDLYYRQQSHKETIMRRQAMLAQYHLEQLASVRLEEMRAMSHIAREQSMLLPAASQLLASMQQQQAARMGSGSTSSSGSSSRQPHAQRQQAWRSRSSSQQRLPSVLEQQQQQQRAQRLPGAAASISQQQVQRVQQEGTVVIDIPSPPFSFPCSSAAHVAPHAWPQGGSSGQQGSGSSSPVCPNSWGSNSTWQGLSAAVAADLTQPLLAQDHMQQPDEIQPCAQPSPNSTAAAAAAAAGVGATQHSLGQREQPWQQQQQQESALVDLAAGATCGPDSPILRCTATNTQQLLLERYLSSSTESQALAAAAAAAHAAVCAGHSQPVPGLVGGPQSPCSASSSSDDSSLHQQQQLQQQHVGFGLSVGAVRTHNPADSRCSCDTTAADVDTPKRGPLGPNEPTAAAEPKASACCAEQGSMPTGSAANRQPDARCVT